MDGIEPKLSVGEAVEFLLRGGYVRDRNFNLWEPDDLKEQHQVLLCSLIEMAPFTVEKSFSFKDTEKPAKTSYSFKDCLSRQQLAEESDKVFNQIFGVKPKSNKEADICYSKLFFDLNNLNPAKQDDNLEICKTIQKWITLEASSIASTEARIMFENVCSHIKYQIIPQLKNELKRMIEEEFKAHDL